MFRKQCDQSIRLQITYTLNFEKKTCFKKKLLKQIIEIIACHQCYVLRIQQWIPFPTLRKTINR